MTSGFFILPYRVHVSTRMLFLTLNVKRVDILHNSCNTLRRLMVLLPVTLIVAITTYLRSTISIPPGIARLINCLSSLHYPDRVRHATTAIDRIRNFGFHPYRRYQIRHFHFVRLIVRIRPNGNAMQRFILTHHALTMQLIRHLMVRSKHGQPKTSFARHCLIRLNDVITVNRTLHRRVRHPVRRGPRCWGSFPRLPVLRIQFLVLCSWFFVSFPSSSQLPSAIRAPPL